MWHQYNIQSVICPIGDYMHLQATGDIDWEQSKYYLTSCTQRRQGTILRRLLVSGGHVRLVRGALTVLRHRRGAWKDGDEDNWETGGLPGHDGGICPEDSA